MGPWGGSAPYSQLSRAAPTGAHYAAAVPRARDVTRPVNGRVQTHTRQWDCDTMVQGWEQASVRAQAPPQKCPGEDREKEYSAGLRGAWLRVPQEECSL